MLTCSIASHLHVQCVSFAASTGPSWSQLWSWGPCSSSAAWFFSWEWRSSEVNSWLLIRYCIYWPIWGPACTIYALFSLFLHLLIGPTSTLCCTVVVSSAPPSCESRTRPSYRTSLKLLLGHIPYQRLLLGFVFSGLAFQVQFESTWMYLTVSINHGVTLYADDPIFFHLPSFRWHWATLCSSAVM